MKFMMIGKATKETEAGQIPTDEELVAMENYTEELEKAGVLVDLAGLAPSSKGARIRYEGKKRCEQPASFVWGVEVVKFFVAHPR